MFDCQLSAIHIVLLVISSDMDLPQNTLTGPSGVARVTKHMC